MHKKLKKIGKKARVMYAVMPVLMTLSLSLMGAVSFVPHVSADLCSDLDEDGICMEIDNCPYDTNADQVDTNTDGVGDACTEQATIRACKFEDIDGDGVKDSEDLPIAGWSMTLDGTGFDKITSVTGDDGCVNFDNLALGMFSLKEEEKEGWVETAPGNFGFSEFVTLMQNGETKEVDFLNHQETTGTTGEISGCKYNDANNNGTIDSSEAKMGGWGIELWRCTSSSASTTGMQASSSSCVLADTATTESATSSAQYGCYTFTDLDEGDYTVKEIPQDGWIPTYPTNSQYAISLAWREVKANVDFLNYQPICGNAVIDEGEACDGGSNCNASCQIIPTTSGGGGSTPSTSSSGGSSGLLPCILNGTSCGATGYVASESSTPTEEPIVKGEEGAPHLTILKTAYTLTAKPGDKSLKYLITVENTGTLAAINTVLKDTLPAGITFITGGTVKSWNLGDLAAGAKKEVVYEVNIAKTVKPGMYKNTAEVKADNNAAISDSTELQVVKIVTALANTGNSVTEFMTLVAIMLGSFALSFYTKRQIS